MTILTAPRILIFDWHGTLVDTNDAMYRSIDDMLSAMDRLGLDDLFADTTKSKSDDESKLVEYVRTHHRLHPKVVSDCKASRTDLLEVLFGSDKRAKNIANQAYNGYYRHHFGDVKPFAPGIRAVLSELRELGIKLGILTNRSREFLDKELEIVDSGSWAPFFDSTVSGGDTVQLKPSPAPVFRALQDFEATPGADVWYVGDSASDTISAKTAGISSIFFNGAQGDAEWLKAVFPGTAAYPHQPDSVVSDYRDLLELVKRAIADDARARLRRGPG